MTRLCGTRQESLLRCISLVAVRADAPQRRCQQRSTLLLSATPDARTPLLLLLLLLRHPLLARAPCPPLAALTGKHTKYGKDGEEDGADGEGDGADGGGNEGEEDGDNNGDDSGDGSGDGSDEEDGADDSGDDGYGAGNDNIVSASQLCPTSLCSCAQSRCVLKQSCNPHPLTPCSLCFLPLTGQRQQRRRGGRGGRRRGRRG